MSAPTSALGPPPRTYSLHHPSSDVKNSNTSGRQSFATASNYDEEDNNYDSKELIEEAEQALTRVEDGWSATELVSVSRKLIDRIQHLVSLSLPFRLCIWLTKMSYLQD